jgi:hypothetical protein
MCCGGSEIKQCLQTSSAGTPVSPTGTILFGGTGNTIVSGAGLFFNLSATAQLNLTFQMGGALLTFMTLGPLETRAFTVLGFDTIVATATTPANVVYTIEVQSRI